MLNKCLLRLRVYASPAVDVIADVCHVRSGELQKPAA